MQYIPHQGTFGRKWFKVRLQSEPERDGVKMSSMLVFFRKATRILGTVIPVMASGNMSLKEFLASIGLADLFKQFSDRGYNDLSFILSYIDEEQKEMFDHVGLKCMPGYVLKIKKAFQSVKSDYNGSVSASKANLHLGSTPINVSSRLGPEASHVHKKRPVQKSK